MLMPYSLIDTWGSILWVRRCFTTGPRVFFLGWWLVNRQTADSAHSPIHESAEVLDRPSESMRRNATKTSLSLMFCLVASRHQQHAGLLPQWLSIDSWCNLRSTVVRPIELRGSGQHSQVFSHQSQTRFVKASNWMFTWKLVETAWTYRRYVRYIWNNVVDLY
jgi:hypothetical protein